MTTTTITLPQVRGYPGIDVEIEYPGSYYMREFYKQVLALETAVMTKMDLSFIDLSFIDLMNFNGLALEIDFSDIRLFGVKLPVGIPVISNIHQAVFDAVKTRPRALNMSYWSSTYFYDNSKQGGYHTCGTSHCRGGWVVDLAEAWTLKNKLGFNTIATFIYQASDPSLKRVPDFYATDKEAMADIKFMAEQENNHDK